MDVSEVRLNLLKTDNAVKAIGSFALDGMFAVRGVRVSIPLWYTVVSRYI